MIKNQWYGILESCEVKKNKPIGVLRLGERLVLFRNEKNEVVCLSDICAHRGASLSHGKVTGSRIKCPFHGLEFNTKGQCTIIPANGKVSPVPKSMSVKSYPCREMHGFIFIYYADILPKNLPEPEFFDDIDDSMSQLTDREHWNTHYTRAIENQLDPAHLPFVHYNTIGRGNKTVVDGPGVEWVSEKRMNIYVYNHTDDGTVHKKPSEVPIPNPNKFKLEFRFPNLWQNYISPKMRIVGVFAPVDEENVVIYFRLYQSVVRFPLLKTVFNHINRMYARKIAGQDKHVVETQMPKKPDPQKEHLFMADTPIADFRRKMNELKQAELK